MRPRIKRGAEVQNAMHVWEEDVADLMPGSRIVTKFLLCRASPSGVMANPAPGSLF